MLRLHQVGLDAEDDLALLIQVAAFGHPLLVFRQNFRREAGEEGQRIEEAALRAGGIVVAVFGAQDHHWVFAVHDDVTNAYFLSGFHGVFG